MAQPRKEQVKNLKTKYTRFTGAGSLTMGGGPVQAVSNTIVESFYDELLAATRTGTVGGAETSAPAVMYGSSGPYTLSAGNSFNLTMTGVNGGSAMPVVVDASDVVTLGGSPVVPTSRMAARINTVVASYGVPHPVCANVGGGIVLTSKNASGTSVGDDVEMTVSEVTPGILNVLGLTSLAAVTATGTTAPKRGIVTASADGQGGFLQLRRVDTGVPDAASSVLRQTLYGRYVPEVIQGQPVHARVIAFAGPPINGRNLTFTYYRSGPLKPSVVTGAGAQKSNFSTLTGVDSVSVGLEFGDGQSISFNVTFSPVPGTAQDVVDIFNAAFSAASLLETTNYDSTRAEVPFRLGGTYKFTDPATKDSFFIAFNGNAPIHINPAAGTYTAETFRFAINAAITAAGQAAEGIAGEAGGHVILLSNNTNVEVASIQILPGNPGGSVPGSFMGTLDMLGLTPGIYKPGRIATLYGQDEIQLLCPSPLPGARLTVSGMPAVLAKLGLSSAVNVTSSYGLEPVVAPTSHVLIPEMIEFHEVPDDYDPTIESFDNKAFNKVRPVDGAANSSASGLLGLDGKVDPSLLPRLLDFVGLDQLRLGPRSFSGLLAATLTPKVLASHDADGATPLLVFESEPITTDPALLSTLRVYVDKKTLRVTSNAKVSALTTDPTPWSRDSSGVGSSMVEYDGSIGSLTVSYRKTAHSSPWADSGWQRSAVMSSQGAAVTGDILKLGDSLTANPDNLKARLAALAANDVEVLLFAGRSTTSSTRGNVRFYLRVGGAAVDSSLAVVVNAVYDGATWTKDVNGQLASRYVFGTGKFFVQYRPAAQDAAWNHDDWSDAITHTFDSLLAAIGGSVELGSKIVDPSVPKVKVARQDPGTNKYILVLESPSAGANAFVPLRLYAGTTDGDGRDSFTFTYNARWNPGTSRWVQDEAASPSYAWVMGTLGFWVLKNAAGTSPWVNDYTVGWAQYHIFNQTTKAIHVKDGLLIVESPLPGGTSNPIPSVAAQNTLYAKSMVKSWGKIRGDGPTLSDIAIIDGFNCASVGFDGGAGAFSINFAAAMGDPQYGVFFGGRSTNTTTPPTEPASYGTWDPPQAYLHNAIVVSQSTTGFTYYPLVGVNGGFLSGSLGDIRGYYMYYMVLGSQY